MGLLSKAKATLKKADPIKALPPAVQKVVAPIVKPPAVPAPVAKALPAPIAKAVAPTVSASSSKISSTTKAPAMAGIPGIGGILGGGGGGIQIPGLGGGAGGILSKIPGWDSSLNPLGPQTGGITGNLSHPGGQKKVDSTGEVQNVIDKYSAENPYVSAMTGAGGTLGDQFKVQAGPAITAGALANPNDISAGTVKAGALDVAGLTPDQTALNAIKDKALATGPSAWAKLALDQNNLDLLNAKDQAGAQALSGANTAGGLLAMRGGLGGGAAERIATNASRDMNASRQAAGRNAALGRLGVLTSDEQQKNALLTQVPGMELANKGFLADMNKFNIGTDLDSQKFNVGSALDATKFNTGLDFETNKANVGNTLAADQFNSSQTTGVNSANATNALTSLGADNNFKLGKFQTQIAGYGSAKSADAMANAGKK